MATALLKPRVKNFSSLNDVNVLSKEICTFQPATTVAKVLAPIDSIDSKMSSRHLAVSMSTDTAEDGAGSFNFDDDSVSETEAEPETTHALKLKGFRKAVRPRVPMPTKFPNRKEVQRLLEEIEDHGKMLNTATKNINVMLSLILGLRPNEYKTMKLEKKIEDYGKLPDGKSPTKRDMDIIRLWRNDLIHAPKVNDLEQMGTNKETFLCLFERVTAQLELLWDSKQRIERLSSDNESLSDDNQAKDKEIQAKEKEIHKLKSQLGQFRRLSEIQANDKEIQAREKEIHKLKSQLGQLRRQSGTPTMDKEIQAKEKEIHKLKSQLGQFRRQSGTPHLKTKSATM